MLSARKYAPHRQRRLRRATLYPTELQARCYGINDLRVLRPFGFAYALHNRQTPEISRPKFAWATGSICIVEQRADFVHHKDDRLRKEFEKWAGHRSHLYKQSCCHVINEKRGADAGIDGIAYSRLEKRTTQNYLSGQIRGVSRQGYRNLGGRCAADGIPSRRPHHARTRCKTDDDSGG